MKTVKILESFQGYPDPKKRAVAYAKGDEVEVPEAFAKLIIEKGHAKEVEPKVEDKPAEKPAHASKSTTVAVGEGKGGVGAAPTTGDAK